MMPPDREKLPGLTIASLRDMAAGVPPDTPLLVPRADGEGYEPLVMASAIRHYPNVTGSARGQRRPAYAEKADVCIVCDLCGDNRAGCRRCVGAGAEWGEADDHGAARRADRGLRDRRADHRSRSEHRNRLGHPSRH